MRATFKSFKITVSVQRLPTKYWFSDRSSSEISSGHIRKQINKQFPFFCYEIGIWLKMLKHYFFLFCLCLQYKLFKADFTSSTQKQNYIGSSVPYIGESYLSQNIPECTQILEQFAVNASELTKCSIRNARPIRICEKCIDEYVNFYNNYQALLNTIINGTSCESVLISLDRLDAISEYYNGILAIWKKGNCNTCYDWSKGKPVLSNQTLIFKKKYNVTMDCISNNLHPDLSNKDEVCEKCKPSYLQLDDYYKSMSTDSIGLDTICMDIVDSMNATRSIWSKTLNCCKLRRSPEIIFLCCTVIISILPLIYYLALRFCGPIRDLPNVLKQTRFKQMILRSVNGRIN